DRSGVPELDFQISRSASLNAANQCQPFSVWTIRGVFEAPFGVAHGIDTHTSIDIPEFEPGGATIGKRREIIRSGLEHYFFDITSVAFERKVLLGRDRIEDFYGPVFACRNQAAPAWIECQTVNGAGMRANGAGFSR